MEQNPANAPGDGVCKIRGRQLWQNGRDFTGALRLQMCKRDEEVTLGYASHSGTYIPVMTSDA